MSTTNPNPRLFNATWSDTTEGSASLTIPPNDKHACTVPCRYYLGIRGASGTTVFSVVAQSAYSNSSLTQLLDGIPQNGHVEAGGMQYYEFYAPNTPAGAAPVDIEFVATPRRGNVELYVGNKATQSPVLQCNAAKSASLALPSLPSCARSLSTLLPPASCTVLSTSYTWSSGSATASTGVWLSGYDYRPGALLKIGVANTYPNPVPADYREWHARALDPLPFL